MTTEERFERIEKKHEELAEFVGRIAEGHIELEAAQLNQTRAHTRLEESLTELTEKIGNLTILVDRLIERDLQR